MHAKTPPEGPTRDRRDFPEDAGIASCRGLFLTAEHTIYLFILLNYSVVLGEIAFLQLFCANRPAT